MKQDKTIKRIISVFYNGIFNLMVEIGDWKFGKRLYIRPNFKFQISNFFIPIRNIMLAVSFSSLLFSCEKDITIDLPNADEKVVIEGYIDINDYSRVFLTHNISYFGTTVMDSAMLVKLLITDATVIVSDGVIFDSLNLNVNLEYFPPVFYSGSKIKGEAGKTYSLIVKADGKTFTSSTTIPAPVPLHDSWFKLEQGQDSLGYVWADFTDPPEPNNYYRLFTKRLNKDNIFIPIMGSAYDDKLFNGQTFTFSMMRGVKALNATVKDPEFGFFKKGDTVVIKSCTIDKANYDFWRSAEGNMYGGSNPFSNPSQITSNIEGEGALGVWGGYGASYDTVIAQ